MEYTVKRSKRKSIGIEITDDGVLVRAPLRASRRDIERVVAKHSDWITEKIAERDAVCSAAREKGILTGEEIGQLIEKACEYIPGRVAYYARQLGVRPGKITIRNQRTRWGSCSAKGNLNFNCLLMLAPEEVIDSVVVHELCHLLEMNHSPEFYRHVLSVFPDYYEHHAWLKENGKELMARNADGQSLSGSCR